MQTFRDIDQRFGLIPAELVQQLTALDLARGRQEAFRLQAPGVLEALREDARIESVEASNAIENITAPRKRIEALVEEGSHPRNRSEEEIAGYRDVLDTIHASAEAIQFTPNVVLQLHRDLLKFAAAPGGEWKSVDNVVEEELPDGSRSVRFIPVSAFETPRAMEELHERFRQEWDAERIHRVLLIASYVLDFLIIHPFRDGNGRMSRLLTSLLLLQAGYDVGRFVSIEKLIEETRATYYDSLGASTAGWHESTHDTQPWTRYILGILIVAYRQFEERVAAAGGRGAKAEHVRRFVRSNVADTFSFDELRRASPRLSDAYMRQVLRQLKAEGVVRPLGKGRGAKWQRIRTDT